MSPRRGAPALSAARRRRAASRARDRGGERAIRAGRIRLGEGPGPGVLAPLGHVKRRRSGRAIGTGESREGASHEDREHDEADEAGESASAGHGCPPLSPRRIGAGYARIALTTFPWTFVRRRRMPSW